MRGALPTRMHRNVRCVVSILAVASFASCAKQPAIESSIGTSTAIRAPDPVEPEDGFNASVNGVKLHYLRAKSKGNGTPVILLHGYAETSHMWRPLLAKLSEQHDVIAPDLRGVGSSDKPPTGYDKKTLATDVHALAQSLGLERVKVVGHDIGLMVAYAYAAQFPEEVESLVLMDAFLPGIGDWKHVWLTRDLWHFHFSGETPLKLVEGRERTYFEHFWNDFAADRTRSIPEADRRVYAAAYGKPGSMRAGFEYFKAFEKDATDFAELSQTKLTMPVLVLTGEKASGTVLIDQACLVAKDVTGVVITNAGHWLMEEAPTEVMTKLRTFLDGDATTEGTKCAGKTPDVRLSSNEIDARGSIGGGPGTSNVNGIRTTVLKGDPTKEGLYTISLHIPPNTKIESHYHADDRVATVVSGTWYLGYGSTYDEKELRPLTAGSFYTESPSAPHFAKTGKTAAVVQISGVGPTSTVFASKHEELTP